MDNVVNYEVLSLVLLETIFCFVLLLCEFVVVVDVGAM